MKLLTSFLIAGHVASAGNCAGADWSDTYKTSCSEYGQMNYCTADGDFGIGWNRSGKTFADYAWAGFTALNCVECGCVEVTEPATTAAPCNPDVANWMDTDNTQCEGYKSNNYCTSDGQHGSGWDDSWGVLQDYISNGYHGFNCPQCGCGVEEAAPAIVDSETIVCPNNKWNVENGKCTPIGVSVQCNADTMVVTFDPLHLYVKLDSSHVDQSTSAAMAGTCAAVESVNNVYTLTFGLDECGTTVKQADGKISFSNTIKGSGDALKVDNIMTTQALELEVTCVFDETFDLTVENIGIKAGTHTLDGSSNTGDFKDTFSLTSYTDDSYKTASTTSAKVIIGNPIYSRVTVDQAFPNNLDYVVTGCVAMDNSDSTLEATIKYTVLEDGCLDKLLNTQTSSLHGDTSTPVEFYFNGFTFESSSDILYLECSIQICATNEDGTFLKENCGYDSGTDSCATMKEENKSSLGYKTAPVLAAIAPAK